MPEVIWDSYRLENNGKYSISEGHGMIFRDFRLLKGNTRRDSLISFSFYLFMHHASFCSLFLLHLYTYIQPHVQHMGYFLICTIFQNVYKTCINYSFNKQPSALTSLSSDSRVHLLSLSHSS